MSEMRKRFIQTLDDEDDRRDFIGEKLKESYPMATTPIKIPARNPDGSRKETKDDEE